MPSKKSHTDQLGREVTIPANPKRIISVVPSQTELLFYLGLQEQVVGVTKFCIHPATGVAAKAKIGGTKQLDIEKIKSLQPDLIIANKEENERSQIEELMNYFPVWISDVYDLPGALQMIENISDITDKPTEARKLISDIEEGFQQLVPITKQLSVAYLIWRKPYMTAGNETYIDDMLSRCGLVNCLNDTRYPEVDASKLAELNPDVVLLSSEPYPFKQRHVDEFKSMLPNARVLLVDGEMFSWYGSRLQFASKYFAEIIKMLENQS
ncbi:ABC transporter substrate-binding protein [Mucilaginibacter agri]|uniref:ABC transporter substrate-binding protein n=1 Tax=Mucilaginibacter agri TaxID=2695265 RepID=A0A966DSH7_9SPHI|nr:helical backbone metal receptor [Mucilaginibacter agri]NCD70148.1 ABC transporter substrate-binding protein [Mucilaginibacter agri]